MFPGPRPPGCHGFGEVFPPLGYPQVSFHLIGLIGRMVEITSWLGGGFRFWRGWRSGSSPD